MPPRRAVIVGVFGLWVGHLGSAGPPDGSRVRPSDTSRPVTGVATGSWASVTRKRPGLDLELLTSQRGARLSFIKQP
jgi:hypothetical protein